MFSCVTAQKIKLQEVSLRQDTLWTWQQPRSYRPGATPQRANTTDLIWLPLRLSSAGFLCLVVGFFFRVHQWIVGISRRIDHIKSRWTRTRKKLLSKTRVLPFFSLFYFVFFCPPRYYKTLTFTVLQNPHAGRVYIYTIRLDLTDPAMGLILDSDTSTS